MSDYCVYYGVRMDSYKTGRERDVQEVAQTERERETLVKLARYNRKHSNLLLITAWPLLHRPSRQRGGQQQQSQVLPPLPSDNNSVCTRNMIIHGFEGTLLSSHTQTHTHTLAYSSQFIKNALTLQLNGVATIL